MKKREIAWILIIIILFLILMSLFIYSKYKSLPKDSEGTFNSLSNFLIFIVRPVIDPLNPILKPKGPYGDALKKVEVVLPPGAIDPNAPIPDDLNKPINHQDDIKLPPSIKINPNQKPTPAPPKPIYDFWKKFWESLYKLFNQKHN